MTLNAAGKNCTACQDRLTFVPEPKGSEPSPRKVCQNATLKRNLHISQISQWHARLRMQHP